MFFKKKETVKIVTRVIKTGSQLEHENRVRDAAYNEAKICPVCKHVNSIDPNPTTSLTKDWVYNYHGECTECKSTWLTEFKY